LGFKAIIFRSRNAKKSIKGSIDLSYSQKVGSLVWRPGPDNLGQNAWTYPYYDITHKKNHNISNFKKFELQDFLRV